MMVLLRTKNSNKLFQTSLLLFGILLLNLVPLTTTVEAIAFERTYGGTNREAGTSVQQTSDGGYIITGYTRSFGAGWTDVYLVKTDSLGDTLWTRTYGGQSYDGGLSVQQTSDGGYIIAGSTSSFGAGLNDVYLIKTDSSGQTIWSRTYGGAKWDWGYSVDQTSDGGYVIAGVSHLLGSPHIWLIKTDPLGDTLWTRMYGGTGVQEGRCVRQTSDGGYIIAGTITSLGSEDEDVYVVRTNPTGDTLWTRTVGGAANDWGHSVEQTSDGGYIIKGSTGSFGAVRVDAYLIKMSSLGSVQWIRTYGGVYNDVGLSVHHTTDGGFIVAGWTASFGAGTYDVYLVKTNSSGDTLWTRTYGGGSVEEGYSVNQTSDGGYITVGYTESFGAGESDVYLVKTEGLADTTCDPVCLKENVLAELDTLNPQSKHVAKGIKKAKKHIEKSLESKRWLDETHLHRKHGKKVFYEEKKAVKDIKKLCKKGDFPEELCERLIGMLVEADSILARVAIDDAKAAGGKEKEIQKAEKEMAKAEKNKEKGKYEKAIDHYKKAWQHAIKATKHHKANQTERTTQPSSSRSLTNP